MTARLRQLADEPCSAPKMGPQVEAVAVPVSLRLYYRQRGDSMRVLAAWWGKDPGLPGGSSLIGG